ncbi:MAG: hypothetical protein DRN53_06505 [Thermoprotei archaeon]|nr:MAG: hypothetical protein DRN53_06505 [Thermoprotei archaeon]
MFLEILSILLRMLKSISSQYGRIDMRILSYKRGVLYSSILIKGYFHPLYTAKYNLNDYITKMSIDRKSGSVYVTLNLEKCEKDNVLIRVSRRNNGVVWSTFYTIKNGMLKRLESKTVKMIKGYLDIVVIDGITRYFVKNREIRRKSSTSLL